MSHFRGNTLEFTFVPSKVYKGILDLYNIKHLDSQYNITQSDKWDNNMSYKILFMIFLLLSCSDTNIGVRDKPWPPNRASPITQHSRSPPADSLAQDGAHQCSQRHSQGNVRDDRQTFTVLCRTVHRIRPFRVWLWGYFSPCRPCTTPRNGASAKFWCAQFLKW